jgi:hypothetical protein
VADTVERIEPGKIKEKTMTLRISKHSVKLSRMAELVLAGFLTLATGIPATAQTANSAATPSLRGTWRVQVTLYNCKTGQQFPPFSSLLSFNGSGTYTGTTSNPAFQPGQRTADQGSWSHVSGNSYQAASEAFILFTSTNPPPAPVFQQGRQRITQAITLSGDTFTSVASVQFFDVSGNLVLTGCATAAAQRFK